MFRFTIRELVLLTLVVAMGVGWWMEWSTRRGDWSIVVPDTVAVADGLNPGDKVELELLPNGEVARRVIRRRP
jgi:hypothetical protein